MKTKILSATVEEINIAADLIRRGEVVGMPTETVYGLAANAFDEEAIKKVFIAKGRPQDNPLIVHIYSISQLKDITSEFDGVRKRLAEAFWPGPLTIIFPKSEKIPDCVTAGLNTVAVRMPSHKLALALIEKAGVPIAAPSANISGKPSPTSAEHVYEDLKNKIPAIIDGGSCDVGVESTVVAVKDNTVTVLRPGGITVEMIKKAFHDVNVQISDAVLRELNENEAAPSPGMKHKHYSPKAKVLLCEGNDKEIVSFANTYENKNAVLICDSELSHTVKIPTMTYCGTSTDEAKHIFDYLRRADADGYAYIIVSLSDNSGMGLALNNRLLRSAGFEVIKL